VLVVLVVDSSLFPHKWASPEQEHADVCVKMPLLAAVVVEVEVVE